MKGSPVQDRVTDMDRIKDYRTELPNIIDDFGLSVYAHRLYTHYKRACGADGSCEQGVRYIAQLCQMSIGSVTQAKKELVECGLIWIEPINTRGGVTDKVTLPDLWKHNFTIYLQPSGEKRDQAVAEMKRSLCEHPLKCSSCEHLRSRGEHQRSSREHKKEHLKKEQSEKNTNTYVAKATGDLQDDAFYIILEDLKAIITRSVDPRKFSQYKLLTGSEIKADPKFAEYKLALSAPLPQKKAEPVQEELKAPPVPPPPPSKAKQPAQYGDMFVLVNRYSFKAAQTPFFKDLTGKATKALLRAFPDASCSEFECFAKDWNAKPKKLDFPSGEVSLPKNFGLWRQNQKGVTYDADNSGGGAKLRGLIQPDFADDGDEPVSTGARSASA